MFLSHFCNLLHANLPRKFAAWEPKGEAFQLSRLLARPGVVRIGTYNKSGNYGRNHS